MIVSWFSCGDASAVASKLTLLSKPDVIVARCVVANEHPDNDRVARDYAVWFGQPILNLASAEFSDCWEVWESRRYISGIKGAPCTLEMKKAVRWDFERQYQPEAQVFGFTVEERKRADQFRQNNPDVKLLTPLIDAGLTKQDCFELVRGAGLQRSAMYDLGFSNANCICCAKATSIVYWARNRHYFPEQFSRMSELSRRLGCRLTRLKGKRIFLDEIPVDINFHKKDRENVECGVLCAGAA